MQTAELLLTTMRVARGELRRSRTRSLIFSYGDGSPPLRRSRNGRRNKIESGSTLDLNETRFSNRVISLATQSQSSVYIKMVLNYTHQRRYIVLVVSKIPTLTLPIKLSSKPYRKYLDAKPTVSSRN